MPSCGAPSGSHGSVQSNVYAAFAANDMLLRLYVLNAGAERPDAYSDARAGRAILA